VPHRSREQLLAMISMCCQAMWTEAEWLARETARFVLCQLHAELMELDEPKADDRPAAPTDDPP